MALSSFKRAGLGNANTITRDPSPADFSNTATGTYTDGNGYAWKYVQFNSSGTLTVTVAGLAEILIVSGGGGAGVSGGFTGGPGGGGAAYFTSTYLDAIAYTITVGAGGGSSAQGGFSGIKPSSGFDGLRLSFYGGGGGGGSAAGGGVGSSGGGGSNTSGGAAVLSKAYGGNGTAYVGGGAGGDATANNLAGIGPGISSDITGSSVVYGRGNWASPGYTPTANRGEGGNPSGNAGSSGVVIVRVRTN